MILLSFSLHHFLFLFNHLIISVLLCFMLNLNFNCFHCFITDGKNFLTSLLPDFLSIILLPEMNQTEIGAEAEKQSCTSGSRFLLLIKCGLNPNWVDSWAPANPLNLKHQTPTNTLRRAQLWAPTRVSGWWWAFAPHSPPDSEPLSITAEPWPRIRLTTLICCLEYEVT